MRPLTWWLNKQAFSNLLRRRTVHSVNLKVARIGGIATGTVERDRVSLPRVLVLTGPTAVGKTQLSLALAQQLHGEVISADSVQVYRGLDIGSDKVCAWCRRIAEPSALCSNTACCADKRFGTAGGASPFARYPACTRGFFCWSLSRLSKSGHRRHIAGYCHLLPAQVVHSILLYHWPITMQMCQHLTSAYGL